MEKDKLFEVLEGKSPEAIALIHQSLQLRCGLDLDTLINDELSGCDLNHARPILKGDLIESKAWALKTLILDHMAGSKTPRFPSEQVLKQVGTIPVEDRHAFAQAFARINGGPAAG